MVIRLTKRTYHSTLRYLAISHFDKDINNIEIGWRKKRESIFCRWGKVEIGDVHCIDTGTPKLKGEIVFSICLR